MPPTPPHHIKGRQRITKNKQGRKNTTTVCRYAESASVDVVVFCLSLMGSNIRKEQYVNFIIVWSFPGTGIYLHKSVPVWRGGQNYSNGSVTFEKICNSLLLHIKLGNV